MSVTIALPQVEVPEADVEALRQVWTLIPPHAREIYGYIVEQWSAWGGPVAASKGMVVLRSKSQPDKPLLAMTDDAIMYAAWASLRERWGLPEEDVRAFEALVPRPVGFVSVASSAHLPVGEGFTLAMAEQLLEALKKLDEALTHAVPPA